MALWGNNLIFFFYPSRCLQCEGPLSKPHHSLCLPCFQLIEWLDQKNRCPLCALPLPCHSCIKRPQPLRPHLSLFEGTGPILDLYRDYLKTRRAAPLAALLLLGLCRSSFPLPDAIVPNTDALFRKEEPSFLLASALATLLKRPCGGALEDKNVLLLTPCLQTSTELLDGKRRLGDSFPRKVYSLALIDTRTSDSAHDNF